MQRLQPVSQFASRAGRAAGSFFKGPYGIAAIASLSFHGVLFALGPSVSQVSFAAFGDGADTERTVPLVELSPTEQGRLPNFDARSRFGAAGRLPVPSSPPSFSFDPAPQQRTAQRSGAPQRTFGQGTRSTFRTPFISGGRPSVSTWRLPSSVANIPAPPAQDRPKPQTETPAAPTPEPANPAAGSTAGTQPGTGQASDLSLEGLQNPGSVAGQASTPGQAPTEGTAETPAGTPESLIAARAADAEQLQRLRESLQFKSAGTDAAAAAAESASWRSQLGPDAAEVQTAAVGIDSNLLCVDTPPVNGLVGLVVNPDGSISQTRLLKSTGYDAVNQAALNAASSAPIAPGEAPVPYEVTINVAYSPETCTSPGAVLE